MPVIDLFYKIVMKGDDPSKLEKFLMEKEQNFFYSFILHTTSIKSPSNGIVAGTLYSLNYSFLKDQ